MTTYRSSESSVVNGKKPTKPSINLDRWLIPIAILICVLLGVSLYFLPQITALLLALIGIGIPAFLLIWSRPEFGLIGILFFTSSFISPEDILDLRLPIGGGLDFQDVFFLLVVGMLVFRVLIKKKPITLLGGVGIGLAIFLAMAVFSIVFALVFQNTESNWALNDFRNLLHYCLFFITLWNIEEKKQIDIIHYGMYLIADISVVIIILQQFAGANNPLLLAMSRSRDWRIYERASGARVIPASHLIMHYWWIISFAMLAFTPRKSRWRIFYIFQIIFIGVGHMLTYVRSQWVASVIGLGLMAYILIPKFRDQMPKIIILAVALAMVFTTVIGVVGLDAISKFPLFEGIVDRAVSLFNPVQVAESNSLQWRAFENREAINAILKDPLTGVGLGGRYRDLTTLAGEAMGWMTRDDISAGVVSRFTRYVHNSYLHIAVKMGIPALAVLLTSFILFIGKGWKAYQNMDDSMYKGMVLGILLSFIGILAWAYFHTHLLKLESIPIIAITIGLVGGIMKNHTSWISQPPPENTQTP